LKNNSYHTTVLLKEAIDALQVVRGDKYIDGTLGGGGHTQLILERGGYVLGIDQDSDAIDEVKKRLGQRRELTLVRGNFRDIKGIAASKGFIDCSGIILDLGTSVHQIKASLRGFSFKDHAELDMRMDLSQNLTAKEIVNDWPKGALIDIFERYGEESEAKEIAEEIIKERKNKEIVFADALAEIIAKAKKRREAGINPATKSFQAIRIAVNEELDALREVIESGLEILGSKGRVVIISFHSLEDRIVKQAFLEFERKGRGRIINKKTIQPSFEEKKLNKKARSAKLRVFEKK